MTTAEARRVRADLRAIEDRMVEALGARWQRHARVVRPTVEAVVRAMREEHEQTGQLAERWVAEMLAAINAELEAYADVAAAEIAKANNEAAAIAAAVMAAVLARRSRFQAVRGDEDLARRDDEEDETRQVPRFRQMIRDYWPAIAAAMMVALEDGVRRQHQARKIVDDVLAGFARVADQAATGGRTEMMRAYRQRCLSMLRREPGFRGYRRQAIKDSRCCLGCLMMDGHIYARAEEFDSHPNCRCIPVPIFSREPMPEWQTGPEWFLTLPEEQQREILGRRRWELWQSGAVQRLEDFAVRRVDPRWGGAFVPRPLRELPTAPGTEAVA